MSLDSRSIRRFLNAMREECDRQRRHLRLPGYPRPFYVSYLLRDIHTLQLWGRLGNINQFTNQNSRNAFCDVRVGSYRLDQVLDGGLDEHDPEAESYEQLELPIGNDIDALKYHLWRLTDTRYREAVHQYLRKKSRHVTYLDPHHGLPSFGKAEPVVDSRFRKRPPVDVDAWRDFVERASRVVKDFPQIKSSSVDVEIRDVTRLFVNSQGTQIVDQTRLCQLSCDLWMLTEDGEGLSTRVAHLAPVLGELPRLSVFKQEIRAKIDLLGQLARAPSIKSFAGPVLLAPKPAGILFHEVLGHRLEGNRLLSSREAQTFAKDLNKQVLPSSLTVIDDPTIRRSAGVTPGGSYRYDDEGSPAQRTVLIDRGILVDFLSGRTPIRDPRHRSNGHARSEYHERPISRMGNLIVKATGGLPHDELKKRLIEEVRRQGLPFGIMILAAEGGETATEAYDFQAFMGEVSLAVQVWADGRENLVRNINFVGTPLSTLRHIVAVGNVSQCENAFCGAESGTVPVSTTCVAVLLSNLELQAHDQRRCVPYVLPMPHEKVAKRA